jgi:acetyl-CoA C-acetyltransferase
MRVNTGGSTGMVAVLTAFYHITSGLFDTVLVAGAERAGECGETQKILGKIWDPLYERDLSINVITMLAQSAVRYMHKYGATEEHMAMVAVKNRRNGINNPNAHLQKTVSIKEVLDSKVLSWPIKLFDSCPSSSGACAVVLCSEEKARKVAVPPAWIKGVGNLLETYWVGDRMGPAAKWDHADAGALAGACQSAYKMAGIGNPFKEIDVAELYVPFSSAELHTIEAAGFCEKGEAPKLIEKGVFEMSGALPVSPSGGVMCSHPIAVTGTFLIAEAALQVQHRAGARQVDGAEVALATANGGDHEIFGAFVLGSKK